MTTKNDFSKDLTRSDVEDQQAFEPLKVCQGDVDEKFALTTEEKKEPSCICMGKKIQPLHGYA